MNPQSYYYNCSQEYIQSIDPDLTTQIISIINQLPNRQTQSEINADLFWLLTYRGWNYDTVLKGTGDNPPGEFDIDTSLKEIRSLWLATRLFLNKTSMTNAVMRTSTCSFIS